MEGTRGHARDPLEENWPYLSIGPSTYTGKLQPINIDPTPIFAEPESESAEEELADPIVSESPGAADFDIYETAYGKELERIKATTNTETSAAAGAGAGVGISPAPKVYLTRRVEGKDEVMKFVKDKTLNLQVGQRFSSPMRGPSTPFGAAVSMLRNQIQQQKEQAEAAREEDCWSQGQAQSQARARDETVQQEKERRGSHPYSSIPNPEPSALEATGVQSDAPAEDSAAQLRRLLGRVRDKSGE